MLEKTRTLTVITHLHRTPGYDLNGAAVEGCRQLVESGHSGQIVEHRVAGPAPWLNSSKIFVNLQSPRESDFETSYRLPPLSRFSRFIFGGGKLFPLQQVAEAGWRVAESQDHFFAFSHLARQINFKDGKTREFHFPFDATYYLGDGPHGDTASFQPLFRNVPPGQEYQEHEFCFDRYYGLLGGRSVNYRLFIDGDKVNGRGETPAKVFLWQSVQMMFWYFEKD